MSYNKKVWKHGDIITPEALNHIEQGVEQAHEKVREFVDIVYPVGSIYMSVNAANPGLLFGGVWARIKDTFLLSAGDTYKAGETGGEAEHVLTVDEMPSHRHSVKASSTSGMTEQWAMTRAKHSFAEYFTDTTQVGGNLPHNNMPPYLAVYVWQRTQ